MKKIPIYSGDAVDTSGPSFGFAVLNTDEAGNIILDVELKGAKPNKTYDVWVNQYPSARPQPKPVAPGVLTTDKQGRGKANISVARVEGATDMWISVTSDGECLRSAGVTLN